MTICKNCGSTEIEIDPQLGNAFCKSCAAVLEESPIISEVTFAEMPGGQAVPTGQFVSTLSGGSAIGGLGVKETREAALASARTTMVQISTALNIPGHAVDAALRYYRLALNHNFVQGRKADYVICACLYIACRRAQTAHMLIDFSDVLHKNVYRVGHVFLRLVRLLKLPLPMVDPLPLIHRFASRLEFHEKTQVVVTSAVRLVARMKRDWILIGRRPSGLCGAALLIAARLHGFKRTQKEMIRVVKICDVTLRKRLNEFAATPSGQLTPMEFSAVDLEKESDPPAYIRRKMKAAAVTASVTVMSLEDELEETLKSSEFQKLESHAKELVDLPVVAPIRNKKSRRNQQEIEQNPSSSSSSTSEDEDDTTGTTISFSDDDEIKDVLLTEEEVELKTMMWLEKNKGYLETMEKKREEELRRRKDEEDGLQPRKRKRTTRRTLEQLRKQAPPANAAEAAMQMLTTRKISKRINYSVVQQLELSQFGVLSEATPSV